MPPAGWPKDDLRPDFDTMIFRPPWSWTPSWIRVVAEQAAKVPQSGGAEQPARKPDREPDARAPRGAHDLRNRRDEGARARAPAQGLTATKLGNSPDLQIQRAREITSNGGRPNGDIQTVKGQRDGRRG
ncbi:hypothetical protein PG996_004453 [Apiospora saccharicola]|uniref:Uncharacterized protein n=1 Tax=Apiospora saccharicola TaxID=335842 RepID=A0ABR1W454_9PEZI